jgi:hypothetical protein
MHSQFKKLGMRKNRLMRVNVYFNDYDDFDFQ